MSRRSGSWSPEVLDVLDKRGAFCSGGVAGFFDPHRRLRVMAEDGLVAEILHPGGPIAITPYADPGTRKVSEVVAGAGPVAGPGRAEFPVAGRQCAVGQERAGEDLNRFSSLGWRAIAAVALNGFPAYVKPLARISATSGVGCVTGSIRGLTSAAL
jgi:hypothetical protein